MNSQKVLIGQDSDFRMTTTPNGSEDNSDMRYSRHWFILPFLINLVLLFSASWLVDFVGQNVVGDMSFSFPGWILFATIAASAPPSLAIIRALPDPSIALVIGGFLTSAGLLWTWFETGPLGMISFCVVTAVGISFSVQAVGIALSPYFIRDNITASAGILLLSGCVILAVCPLMMHSNVRNNNIFLYLCPIVIISSLLPVVAYLCSRHQLSKIKQGLLLHEGVYGECTAHSDTVLQNDYQHEFCSWNNSKHVVNNGGWTVSIISLIMWLTWGAGVDTTWLTLGWRYQYFNTSTGLTALQLILCFVLLTIKMCTDLAQLNNSLCRANLASNYMQLGLLGTGGMILCLLPEYTRAFYNHLLFTAGCALQFDDLSELYLVTNSSLPATVFKYKLITYQIGLSDQKYTNYSPIFIICCNFCHMLSLLLMSVLAMILGVQIANILGYLSTLPPLSFICSRGSFMIMSMAAVTISLLRPNMWKGHKQHVTIL